MTAIIPSSGGNGGGNQDSGSAQVGAISLGAPELHSVTAPSQTSDKKKPRGRQLGNLLTTAGFIFSLYYDYYYDYDLDMRDEQLHYSSSSLALFFPVAY